MNFDLTEVIRVKSVTERDGERFISGIATSPTVDRMGDIIDPLGVKFSSEMPLLLNHDTTKVVGTARFGNPTKSGIPFEARIAKVSEPGMLKDLVDYAWQQVKAGLIASVSVGFRVLNDAVESIKGGGLKFMETEVLELSLVPIPANPDAKIYVVKAFQTKPQGGEAPAASGQKAPTVTRLTQPAGVSAQTSKGKHMATPKEQQASLEAKRAANVARIDEILAKAAEDGRTADASEKEELQNLEAEVDQIDDHLTFVRKAVERAKATAQPVPPTPAPGMEIKPRHGEFVVKTNANLPKGMAFARYVKAVAAAKGNLHMALEYSKQWDTSTPEVGLSIKAAVNAGSTSDSSFASSLVYNQNLVSEFVDFLRPKTIIGRMDGFRRVPFNVRYPTQSAGSTVAWVGEGNAKPVSELTLSSGSLGIAKASGIVVITQELARSSAPSAEMLVRDDLVAQMSQFLDEQFIDPSVAAVANTNPASVLNGASNIVTASGGWTSTSTIETDAGNLLQTFATNEIGLDTNSYWVMLPSDAIALSLIRTTNGPFAYPDLNVNGGMFLGLPVITSNSVPSSVSGGSIVALIKSSEIFLADEGGVAIDVSEQASLQMDSAPSNSAASVISLWQSGYIGIKIDRMINWGRRRTYGVGYVDAVHS